MLPVILIAIAILVVLAFLPTKPKSSLGSPIFASARSNRDVEVDEDLASVGDAYRESEIARRKREAIVKVAALQDAAAKSK